MAFSGIFSRSVWPGQYPETLVPSFQKGTFACWIKIAWRRSKRNDISLQALYYKEGQMLRYLPESVIQAPMAKKSDGFEYLENGELTFSRH